MSGALQIMALQAAIVAVEKAGSFESYEKAVRLRNALREAGMDIRPISKRVAKRIKQ